MNSPRPTGHKEQGHSHPRKRRGLVSELKAAWDQPIPPSASQSIAWTVLNAAIADLSADIPDWALGPIQEAASSRSVRKLMSAQQLSDPLMYGSPRSYFAASCALNLLKKFPWEEGEMKPQVKAIERFWSAEQRCRIANRRLIHFRKFDFSDARPLTQRLAVHQIFHLARMKIQRILGPLEEAEILSLMRHGPGGCVGQKRPFTTPYYKLGVGDYTVSGGAYWHAIREVAKCDSWVRALAMEQGLGGWDMSVACIPYETKVRLIDARMSIVDYNEVTFVPKDAKTHRSIAIEPRLNVLLQLGVGRFIKKRLASFGCDLKDQSRNQDLACVGSTSHDEFDPVTLDLEMASDTLPIELVRELLPREWYDLLDNLRSHEGLFEKKVPIKWNKFSSMGNGFTFELESLIFYSLAQAVSDYHGTTQWFADTFGPTFAYAYVSVFGDDIIVPKRDADHLIAVLRFCGFRVNQEKSFLHGPFRESCGSDYFDGIPVRAFYLKRRLHRVRDLIHLRNGLKMLSAHRGVDLTFTVSLVDSLLPDVLRKHLLGWSPTADDGYIWSDPDDCHRSLLVTYDMDHQTWKHPNIRETPIAFRGRLGWRYCQFLYSNANGEPEPDPRMDVRPLEAWKSLGGSAGDVVRSGTTKPSLQMVS